LTEAKAIASGGWKAAHRDDATLDTDDMAEIIESIHGLAKILA
jgi:hypothetical protein